MGKAPASKELWPLELAQPWNTPVSALCSHSPLYLAKSWSLWSQPLPIPSQETFPSQLSHARPSFLEVLSIWPSTSYYSLFILRDTLEVKRPSRSLAGTCQVIQWLQLLPPNARDPSLIPHQGTRSHKLPLRIHMLQLKKKKKILQTTTKTQHSQNM